jgi:hypothetical protein
MSKLFFSFFGKDPKSNAYDDKIISSSYKQPGLYPQNELLTTDKLMTCEPLDLLSTFDGLPLNHGFTCQKNICAIIKKR